MFGPYHHGDRVPYTALAGMGNHSINWYSSSYCDLLISFCIQERKKIADVLKLLLVVSGVPAFVFNLEHWKYNYALGILFRLTMLLTVIYCASLMLKAELKKE